MKKWSFLIVVRWRDDFRFSSVQLICLRVSGRYFCKPRYLLRWRQLACNYHLVVAWWRRGALRPQGFDSGPRKGKKKKKTTQRMCELARWDNLLWRFHSWMASGDGADPKLIKAALRTERACEVARALAKKTKGEEAVSNGGSAYRVTLNSVWISRVVCAGIISPAPPTLLPSPCLFAKAVGTSLLSTGVQVSSQPTNPAHPLTPPARRSWEKAGGQNVIGAVLLGSTRLSSVDCFQ